MESIYFQNQAQLKMNGIQSRSDGSIDVVYNLPEMPSAQAAALHMMRGKAGQLLFVGRDVPFEDKEIEAVDIPEAPTEFKDDKSPSQRLRARMFVYYQSRFKDDKGFYTWYQNKLEEYGQLYLDKLS